MSKATPVAKQVKQNSSFKDNAKFFGLSLISNDTCVQGRKKPWYAAVIIVILSTFLALLPISISYFKQDGGSFLNSPDYGFTNSLVSMEESLKTNQISLPIKNSKLTIDQTLTGKWNTAYPTYANHPYVHEYDKQVTAIPSVSSNSSTSSSSASASTSVSTTPTTTTVHVIDFAAYLLADDPTLSTGEQISAILKAADPAGNATYSINCMFFASTGFYAYKIPSGATGTPKASRACKWDSSIFEGKDLATLASQDIYGNAYTNDATKNPTAYANEVLNAWKVVFSKGYETTKTIVAWQWTGILAAVFAGMALILGLTVFLMTRGKSNPFRIYTFWECQKIAYWASLSPAILAMIVSFIWSTTSFTLLFYIFFFGMRIMWMSMRSLRPQYETK